MAGAGPAGTALLSGSGLDGGGAQRRPRVRELPRGWWIGRRSVGAALGCPAGWSICCGGGGRCRTGACGGRRRVGEGG